MIGLRPMQAVLYQRVVDYSQRVCLGPFLQDVSRSGFNKTGRGTAEITLAVCVQRGFITVTRFGTLKAMQPPHELVVAEVLKRSTVTWDEITGPRKDAKIVVLRRRIAKVLRHDFRYSVPSIALLLGKSKATIEDYFRPESCARRAARRKQKYDARKAIAA